MQNLSNAERALINELKQKNEWICYYCKKTIDNKGDLTVDHIIPQSRGGRTVETNLVICCMECNREKDNLTEAEYKILKRRQDEIIDTLSFTELVANLQSVYDVIITTANQVYSDLEKAENHVRNLEFKITTSTFNACQGYVLAKELQDALLKKERLKMLKEAYCPLHSLIGSNKKQLDAVNSKIIYNLLSYERKRFKDECLADGVEPNSQKVIEFNSIKTVNE